ncbi:MAG TPA: HRDC domain-containing protein [Solirubrobacteraceae bacterium]
MRRLMRNRPSPTRATLNALREWRIAASDGKPAYAVAHNSTLEAIAVLRPTSPAELASIKGVGPAFVERHGADVLALVAETGS